MKNPKSKPAPKQKLHHFIASGGKVSEFRGALSNAVANKK